MPLKKKGAIEYKAIGALIVATVVPTFDLDQEDRDLINGELQWLFAAADNLMDVILEKVDRSEPVSVPLPPEAELSPGANNQLLETPLDYRYNEADGYEVLLRGKSSVVKGGWHRDLDSLYSRMNTRLKNLDYLLKRESTMGAAGKSDFFLQNQITDVRESIVGDLGELANLIQKAYGVLVKSPSDLAEYLEG